MNLSHTLGVTAGSYQAGGWADGRLGVIYDLADDLLRETHPESDAHDLLRRIRDGAEDADMALEKERGK